MNFTDIHSSKEDVSLQPPSNGIPVQDDKLEDSTEICKPEKFTASGNWDIRKDEVRRGKLEKADYEITDQDHLISGNDTSREDGDEDPEVLVEEGYDEVDSLDSVKCLAAARTVNIADFDYIQLNTFPLVHQNKVSSLDSLTSDDSGEDVFTDGFTDTSSLMKEKNGDPSKHKTLKAAARAVRFLGSLSSDSSSETGDKGADTTDASVKHTDSFKHSVLRENFQNKACAGNGGKSNKDIYRRSDSVVKKHASVLGELKSQVKAVKKGHIETEQEQRRRFRAVLNQLESFSLEMDEETRWIHRHIKRRECSHFIPVQTNDSETDKTLVNCQCGYAYPQHSLGAQRNHADEEKWDYKKHSIQKITNAFGDIEFVGYGGNVGKYIRVDVTTKMSDMLDLMMKVWGLDKPNLLISVTGGAKNFQMNKRLKETFRRGLMKTALTTGAWIVTGGTHAGVMKHVGEAVKDFGVASASKNPVISIGIAPWGCIQNKKALIEDKCTGLWPANYRIEKEQKPKESFLDPNHTHFILVDNATEHKFAVEIPFRARLENKIAKIRTDTGDNAVSVPIVLLVLEGGPGTLETVHQSIQNNTPSVVVKGSGRAADILAYAYQNAKEEEIEGNDQEGKKQKKARRFMDDSLLVEVRAMVEREFKTDVDTHVRRIKDCLEKCDLMSVFELDNKSGVKEIDVAMLQALLKANKNQVFDQLRLALAWNRIDVAKSDIFTDDKRWPTGSLDDVMFSAIQLNRVDFIELFLDHGVSLKEFLTKKRLLLLYNKIPPNCLLRTLLMRVKNKEHSQRRNFSLLDVGILIQNLMGDSFRPIYTTREEYALLDVDHLLEGLTMKRAKEGGISAIKAITQLAIDPGGSVDELDATGNPKQQQLTDFENPSQELFIWSVLMIRQDMAKLFWAEGKDAIAAALVANSLLQALRDKTEDTELVIKIQNDINEWSDLAVGVLSECYSTDEHKAQDLLVREQSNWGFTTCMLIAVKADNKDFISQTACQSLLNSIWMGKLAQDNSSWRLLVCVLFPPLALVLLNFHSKHGDKSDNQLPNQVYELENTKQDETGRPKLIRRQTTFMKRGSKLSLQASEEKENPESEVQIRKRMLSIRDRLYYFFNAPVIIFMNNVMSYIVFLGLFTYVLIFDFNQNVSTAEIVLMIWVFTIFSEEIRQVATTASNSLGAKLQSYITDTWNIVDIITIALFIVGMILRFLPTADTFEAARVFLALNFVSFFLRLLHIFSVHKELGPKLVMIGRMVQDLMYFLVILMVFVVSYAIASHSILFPNSPLQWSTTIDIIRKSYWNIYGELFLEEIEGTGDCTHDEMLWRNGTQQRCPTDTGKIVVPIMMGVYMLLANVLLLNLLIAMFSYTFTLVQDNTDKHWFFQRYSLIYEYYTRPVLCPPLIFFSHIYLLAKFVFSCCCCRKSTLDSNDSEDDFRRKFKNERELVQWENVIADAFHQKTELKDFESMEYKVNNTNTLIKDLTSRIDELQEQQLQLAVAENVTHVTPILPVSPSSVVMTMPPKLELRLEALEKSDLDEVLSQHFGSQYSQSQQDFMETNDSSDSDSEVEREGSVIEAVIDARARALSVEQDVDSEEEDDQNDDEGDDQNDNEDRDKVRRFLNEGCGCAKKCHKKFSFHEIYMHRLNVKEMENEARDMYVMGTINKEGSGLTNETKRGKERKRAPAKDLKFKGIKVCRYAFLLCFAIGKKYLNTISTHLKNKGFTTRMHGNTGKRAHNAFSFNDIKCVVEFLKNYADETGLPQPAAPRGRDNIPPIYLPSDTTKKDLHEQYAELGAGSTSGIKTVSLTMFKNIWSNCLPHIRIAGPREDVCATCEKKRRMVMDARTEPEKLEATTALRDHILTAQNMEMTHDSLKWIMKALQEGKVASESNVPPTLVNWEEQRLEEKRKLEIKAGEERAKVREMLLRGINCHFRSRTSPYQGSDVTRFPVPDDKVSWQVDYPEYSATAYTAPVVLQDPPPPWADKDIFNMPPHQRQCTITSFNAVDGVNQVDRLSFLGEYVVQDGLPLNPKGRTGLQSRGLLGRWGPNHAGDPVVTRWKKCEDGTRVMKEGKPVLEFVAVLRADNQMWAIPGAILPPGSKPSDHLEADFTGEALGNLQGTNDEKTIRKKLKKLWKKGVKIYEGYADDPRNTDNAWIETTAFNYHDEDGTVLSQCNLHAGEKAELVTWLTGSHKVTLHGSHLYLVKLAAERLGAYF